MKKRTLLYIPAMLLFIFAISVLVTHFSRISELQKNATRDVMMPFAYNNGRVLSVLPEGEKAGIKVNDNILKMNGRTIENDDIWREEMSKAEQIGQITLTIQHRNEEQPTNVEEITVPLVKVNKGFSYYASLTIGFIYTFFVPTFCIFVGFWVVFVRIHDPLAWLLLFLMLGFSCLGLEGNGSITLIGVYLQIFFSTWALSMFLFALYFPERFALDIRFPWLKWIIIVPLGLQVIISLFSLVKFLTGVGLLGFLRPFIGILSAVAVPLNMLGIGLFFAILGWKSGTLQNPDARRRLKLMVYGTSVAMLPSFLLILYTIILGKQGSFFDNAPWWFAILALLLMLIFPLTMAYIIVVQRAMDVSVVVRQGLQYAFAKGGVRVLQFLLLLGIGLGVRWSINNYGQNSLLIQIAIILVGVALVPLIDVIAKPLRVWIDRKFFREAYNAEQILSDLSEEVRTMVETKPLLETVSGKISESLHVPQVALLLKNGNAFHPAYALGYESVPNVELNESDKTIEKLKKNEPLTVYQDDEESWVNEEIETQEKEKLQKLNSQLLLPIGAKDEVSGVISLSPKLSEEPFTPNDLRLLKSVALQTGLALENSRLTEAIANEAAQKERLNRELEIAREVQERLFPQELPVIEGLDYYGACRPALGVGGDYYDFLELPEGKFGIAIGDISGKGIGASLMMASLQASLRGQTIHFKEELAEMMRHVNTLLYEASTSNRYATFFYSQYDPKTRKLIFVNAGHNPPVLLRPINDEKTEFEIIKLEDGGAVVGMLPSMLVFYKQGEIELQKGDLIVGSTDGITEAMNPQEEEWGEDAMIEELKNVYEKSSEEILHYIVSKADEFANGAKQHDDMTLIVVKVL